MRTRSQLKLMTKTINLSRTIILFVIPLSLLAILIVLMKSSFTVGNDLLNLALTADLLLTIPLVYYLLIRKTTIPKTTVIPVMILGLIIGSYFMPQENQSYLILFKVWALPLIEFAVLTYVIFKVRSALKTYKTKTGSTTDFFTALKSTCSEILPKQLVVPLATEIAIIYYGFFHWKTLHLEENEFTYHKKSGTPALFGALILAIGVETIAFHFLLARWNELGAWVLTALSIYASLQVFGFAKSLSKRPISINHDSLVLKYGILNEVELPFSNISSIEYSSKPLVKSKLTTTLSPLGQAEKHNVVVQLKNEQIATGIYGLKKRFSVIGFHVDNPIGFKKQFDSKTQLV
jgi:hypothetical protein